MSYNSAHKKERERERERNKQMSKSTTAMHNINKHLYLKNLHSC